MQSQQLRTPTSAATQSPMPMSLASSSVGSASQVASAIAAALTTPRATSSGNGGGNHTPTSAAHGLSSEGLQLMMRHFVEPSGVKPTILSPGPSSSFVRNTSSSHSPDTLPNALPDIKPKVEASPPHIFIPSLVGGAANDGVADMDTSSLASPSAADAARHRSPRDSPFTGDAFHRAAHRKRSRGDSEHRSASSESSASSGGGDGVGSGVLASPELSESLFNRSLGAVEKRLEALHVMLRVRFYSTVLSR